MTKTPSLSAEPLAWDRPIASRKVPAPDGHHRPLSAGRTPTVETAIASWLTARAFAPSTARGARQHLESGRARGWRAQRGIATIDQFTADAARDYLIYLRDRGAAPATLRKVKTLLNSLAAFCADTPGYEAGIRGDAMTALHLPPLVERIPTALTETECVRLIAACGNAERDRLIVETFLLTGLRVSELCALTLDALHLDTRPAYVEVRGSVHNPRRPKTPRERRIVIDYDTSGFGRGYTNRLRHFVEAVRPLSYHRELFLSSRRDANGQNSPLTRDGVEQLMARLETHSGIHCNPHKLRHTFATRCVDKGVPMFHLQDALGHSSLDMVRRYYSQSRHAQAEGFYRAFATSRSGGSG
jgi:site-specific recombinase XerD